MSFFGTSEQFTRSLPANRIKIIRVNHILSIILNGRPVRYYVYCQMRTNTFTLHHGMTDISVLSASPYMHRPFRNYNNLMPSLKWFHMSKYIDLDLDLNQKVIMAVKLVIMSLPNTSTQCHRFMSFSAVILFLQRCTCQFYIGNM